MPHIAKKALQKASVLDMLDDPERTIYIAQRIHDRIHLNADQGISDFDLRLWMRAEGWTEREQESAIAVLRETGSMLSVETIPPMPGTTDDAVAAIDLLRAVSLKELQRIAKERNLPGRSGMSQDELVVALLRDTRASFEGVAPPGA